MISEWNLRTASWMITAPVIINVFFVLLIATSECNTATADTTEEEQIVQVQVIDTYYKAPYNTIIGSVP